MTDSIVGIIVLNWNGLADTRECLNSLLQMAGPTPRIYVVDNGSSDGSVKSLRDEFGERIVLIANDRNLLYAGGNNVGILRALKDDCSHILLLNNDTLVDAAMLEELLSTSRKQGNAVLCPKIYYANRPNVLWYAGGKLNLRRARFSHRGIREIDHGQYDQTEETGWATGCALFASRQVFETVGLLDDTFQLYSEDVDYSLRARAAGFPIVYASQARLYHKVSAAMGGNLSPRKLTRKWKGLRLLMKKHVKNPVIRYIALLDFMITETVRVAFAGARGKLR